MFIGLGGAESVEEESAVYASDIKALTDDLKEDVSTLKIVVERMGQASKAASENISDEVGKDLLNQYDRLEGDKNAIEESVDRFIKLAEDPTANREEMRVLVYDLFGQILKFSEDNDNIRCFINAELLPYAEQEEVMWIGESSVISDWVQGAAFEHISELGEKLQNPIVWEYYCFCPINPKRLDNGNTLIAEVAASQVVEVTPDKEIVWEYTDIDMPTEAQRLENGNTLITDRHGHRVIEVSPNKETVWEYKNDSLHEIFGVQRLSNGNTLIADQFNNCVIEVNPAKEIVWEYGSGAANETLYFPSIDQRLENGNTLIGDNAGMLNNSSARAIEVTPDKKIAWEYDEGLAGVYTLQRLESGNTLICDQFNNRIIEVNPAKEIVWTYGAIFEPAGVQRLDNGNTLISVFAEHRIIEVAGAA